MDSQQLHRGAVVCQQQIPGLVGDQAIFQNRLHQPPQLRDSTVSVLAEKVSRTSLQFQAKSSRLVVWGTIGSVDMGKHGGNGVCQMGVDAARSVGVHVHVHCHDAVLLQVVTDQREKLRCGHLKGDGDVLRGVHQNHVVLLVYRLQVGPPVVMDDVLRKIKVRAGQICNEPVHFHAFDGQIAVGGEEGKTPRTALRMYRCPCPESGCQIGASSEYPPSTGPPERYRNTCR